MRFEQSLKPTTGDLVLVQQAFELFSGLLVEIFAFGPQAIDLLLQVLLQLELLLHLLCIGVVAFVAEGHHGSEHATHVDVGHASVHAEHLLVHFTEGRPVVGGQAGEGFTLLHTEGVQREGFFKGRVQEIRSRPIVGTAAKP